MQRFPPPLRPHHRQGHQLEVLGLGEVTESEPVRCHQVPNEMNLPALGAVEPPRVSQPGDLAVLRLAVVHAGAVIVADHEVGRRSR